MPEDAPKNKDAVSPWPSWSRVQEAMETTKDAVTTVAPHGYSGYDAETGLPSPRIITLPIIRPEEMNASARGVKSLYKSLCFDCV